MSLRPKTNPADPRHLPVWLQQIGAYRGRILAESDLPPALKPWVYLSGSMTQAVATHYGKSPNVSVHFSGADTLSPWEAQQLNAPMDTTHGYVRHISLDIDENPVLAARSVTCLASSIEPLLRELQNTPLAKLLFEDPNWQRCGDPIPILDNNGHFGRVCAWQAFGAIDRLLVEEFFIFHPH